MIRMMTRMVIALYVNLSQCMWLAEKAENNALLSSIRKCQEGRISSQGPRSKYRQKLGGW